MTAMHVHTFTDEEADTLQASIRGIRNAIAAWNRKSDKQKKESPLRYELDSSDEDLLQSMSSIHAGDEIELDSCTWVWLQVLLETWMSDAPPKSLGHIWALTGAIAALVERAPDRVADAKEDDSDVVFVQKKSSQLNFSFA